MNTPTLLLIEDDLSQREALEEYLTNKEIFTNPNIEVYSAPNGELAKVILNKKEIDLVLSDLRLPDCSGISLIKEARKIKETMPFLLLTGDPSIETAIDAVRQGANDYLLKPVDLTLLKSKIESLLETIILRKENENLKERLQNSFASKNIIGASQVLQNLLEKVKQISVANVTVLLEGESGTGKEMIANLIHESSTRQGKLFVKVNCGALTKTLLESELFGAVKGAYTGSEKDRRGYFEASNGGSIFLDEIGEMDMESQVRLLRVIEDRKVVRVGSTKIIPIDVRIITATNKNLLEEVNKGTFREDLYYRLSVIKLKLPTLRERIEDLPLLFNHFIVQFNEKYEKSITGMTKELLRFCYSYPWPGNIREFCNVLEGMALLAREEILSFEDLPQELQDFPKNIVANKVNIAKNISPGLSMEEYEKAIIKANLVLFKDNREKTARSLGIAERTLYRKIKIYGL